MMMMVMVAMVGVLLTKGIYVGRRQALSYTWIGIVAATYCLILNMQHHILETRQRLS